MRSSAPRQIDRGGPVVLVQIENEYGAYGDDTAYLEHLVRVTQDAGITVPLTTIDQPTDQMLRDGSVEGVHLTGSFGSRAPERLATLRRHQPTGPLMCAEFWDGWFDWWGNAHHTTPASASAAELDALLAAGASVNFYMFHGGTNFGAHQRSERQGPVPADRDLLRLRRAARRARRPDREVLRLPRRHRQVRDGARRGAGGRAAPHRCSRSRSSRRRRRRWRPRPSTGRPRPSRSSVTSAPSSRYDAELPGGRGARAALRRGARPRLGVGRRYAGGHAVAHAPRGCARRARRAPGRACSSRSRGG